MFERFSTKYSRRYPPASGERLAPALGRVVCRKERLSWDSVSEISSLEGPDDIKEEPQQHLDQCPTTSSHFCPDLNAAPVEMWLGHTLLHGGHLLGICDRAVNLVLQC